MDLEAVVCLYNGIWLHHKTEWTNAFVSNIDGPGDARTKWRKSEEDQNPRASLMGQIEKSVKRNSSIKQTDSQTKKRNFWWPKVQGGVEGERNQEVGINI